MLIGKTTRKINAGCLVDHNNIYSVPRDYESELVEEKGEEPVEIRKTENGEKIQFLGYRRSDGRVGIRNHVLILPACACGSESSRIVASQVRGAVNIVFNTGCSDVADNTAMSQKILTGFACCIFEPGYTSHIFVTVVFPQVQHGFDALPSPSNAAGATKTRS